MEDSLPGDSPGSSPTDHATEAAYRWPPSLIRMLNRLRWDTRAAPPSRTGLGSARQWLRSPSPAGESLTGL